MGAAQDRPPGAEDLDERPCTNERAHWRHPWTWPFTDGAVLRRWWCEGTPARTAAFADHRYVDVVRCYQADGKQVCRRMLVMEQTDGFAEPGDMFGWTRREFAGGGAGHREWRCPAHSIG